MKKTLIALAALAAGSAFAQSNVTLYGRVDVGYAHTTNVNTGMVSGFNSPTIFGLKGSEDLGNGLKANFGLETGGINAATGAGNSAGGGLTFSRASWAGLSGGFGAIQLGRRASLATDSQVGFDLNGVTDATALGLAGLSPVLWYGSSRRSSQFVYTSPNFGGFDAALSYITSADNGSAGSRYSLRANYANGPLAVGFVGESAATSANRAAYAVAGSYNFGVAKLAGGWVRSENAVNTGTNPVPVAPTDNTTNTFSGQEAGQGYFLGVSAPLGATTVGAQFANNTALSTKGLELFANYNLSKRTMVYVDAARVTSSYLTQGVNRYAVGLQHNF